VNRNWSDIADAAFVAFVVTCLGLIVFFIGSAIIELVKMFWK
jgi:predicted benzoate:H+ symporter BenE